MSYTSTKEAKPYYCMVNSHYACLRLTIVYSDADFAASQVAPLGWIKRHPVSPHLDRAPGCPALDSIRVSAWAKTCLSRSTMQWHVVPVTAPPVDLSCSIRTAVDREARGMDDINAHLALFGLPPTLRDTPSEAVKYENILPGIPLTGLLPSSPTDQTTSSSMQVPDAKRLIYDSAKLARLDSLLLELKAGDHKVLVYFQMTKMMDLMEEYLVFRQYKYLRLDGSSKLEDRRDMVNDWQSRYVSILSALRLLNYS